MLHLPLSYPSDLVLGRDARRLEVSLCTYFRQGNG